MSAVPERDIGPLIWVKGEIDASFGRAGEALTAFAEGQDRAQLKFAATHMHQAQGALAIVGLEGLTLFSQSLENLVVEGERGQIEPTPRNLALAQRALVALRGYLDELADGQPDQPLRLWPLYAEIQAARGIAGASPSDLFFPDLGQRPPRRPAGFVPPAAPEAERIQRLARSRFQRGLLQFLKDGKSGAEQMRDAVADVESCQVLPASRAFWWASQSLLEVLAAAEKPADAGVKRLCGRLDGQLRRLLAGAPNVSERLMRDVLYQVAVSPVQGDIARQVRETFRMGGLAQVREPGRTASTPLQPMLRELRDAVQAAKDEWDRFCAGAAVGLPQFEAQTARMETNAARIGHPLLVGLAGAIRHAALWLRKEPLKQTEAVAMELATSLLLMENAIENFDRLDDSFQPQADMMIGRLAALQRGETLGPLHAPLLDEMSRLAQERLLMRQVVREIQSNLNQIEQALDNFFRDPEQRSGLEGLATSLKQVEGALHILDQGRAVSVLHECGEKIKTFAAGEGDQTQYEEVASRLSALGFFVASLPYGTADIEALLNPQKHATAATEAGHGFIAGEDVASIEQQLERHKLEARNLAEALKESPQNDSLREKLHQNLEGIRQDANLAGDMRLEQQAGDALQQLAAEPEGAVSLEPALAPATPELSVPSADAARLAASGADEIDAELLSIFLEEADEVLATIAEALAQSRSEPHNHQVLITIRRGFHTLKGSGRMVNLKELGEVAWAVEQVMNRWLQDELDASDELHGLIGDSHGLFSRWVGQLQTGGPTGMDASAVVALAERLKAGDATVPAAVAPFTQDAPATDEPLEPPLPADVEEAPPALLEELPVPLSEEEVAEAPLPALDASDIGGGMPLPLDFGLDDLGQGAPLPPLNEEAPVAHHRTVADMLSELDAAGEELEAIDLADLDLPPLPEEPAELPPLDTAAPALAAIGDEPEPLELESLDEFLSLSDEDGLELIELPEEESLTEPELAADLTPELEMPLQTDALATDAAPAMEAAAAAAGLLPEDEISPPPEPEPEPEPVVAAPRPDAVVIGHLSMSRGLYDSYVDEALSRLATLRNELSQVPLTPFLPPSEAGYRAAHTLAGISGTVGFTPLQRLGKSVEHALERLAHAEASAVEHLDLLNEATTEIEHMVAEVAALRFPAEAEDLAQRLDGLTPSHRPPQALLAVEPVPAPEVAAEPVRAETAPERREIRLEDDLDDQLLPIFLEESVDLMREIESESRRWHEAPTDASPPQVLARLLHTLKGSARMAGAMGLGEVVHALESRVEQAVAAGGASPEFLEGYDATVDRISQVLDRLRAGEAPHDAAEPEVTAGQVASLAPAPVVNLPQDPGETTGGAQQASLRVRADLVDQLVNQAGEMSISRARIEGEMRTLHTSLLDLTENVIRLRKQLREIEIQAESQMQSREAAQAADHGFDPLEFDRFTRFQELTRMMAEGVNDVSTVQHNLLKNLEAADAALHAQSRINRTLAQSLMSVRMVPFNSLATRLHRIVRQTAKELGKKANLDIRGGQVEMDRSVLERVAAPLEHLLRNAITHGIESPETRTARGKPDIGQITLTLAQEGNEISILLVDDGGGLDFPRIRQRALEHGLLDEVAQVTEATLTDFIFHTGFTTATQLTEVAGRGVGMDVVKSETAALGGRIDVSSAQGEGSQFRIYLPLTLAVSQALLVSVAGKTYAIPSAMVEQARELKRAHLGKVLADSGVDWMGARYPYHFLLRLFGDTQGAPAEDHNTWLLLLRSGTQRIALHVDALRGNQEVVVKNIGPQLARVPGIAGATVLGDGEVVLILNPVALAAREASVGARRVPSKTTVQAPAAVVAHVPTIMVVDDSLTVRKITSRLLEREGYRVIVAKDGVDALEQLLETLPDAMLVDIEMPRMDGFDLTRNIRADAKLKGIPIIMITSRTADKHRNYAKEIGVNHYLGKPFREDELLELLKVFAKKATANPGA